nr:Chain E, TYPE III EXPORT PROTEIN PSCE [Pseudomonas aeruginosa CHA]
GSHMMTALETRLSVADGTHAAALRQRLQAALAECRRELARGACPERFQFLQQQARALEGGLGILSQLTED